MADKFYSLKFTGEELWILSEGYAASFTAPEARNAIEISVSEKLQAAVSKMHRAKSVGHGSVLD